MTPVSKLAPPILLVFAVACAPEAPPAADATAAALDD